MVKTGVVRCLNACPIRIVTRDVMCMAFLVSAMYLVL